MAALTDREISADRSKGKPTGKMRTKMCGPFLRTSG